MRHVFTILLFGVFSASAATAGVDETAPALLATGKVDDAIATLHAQIAASPDDALAHNLLCRAYFSLGQWDRGVGECEKAVSLEPQNSEYHLWLGRIYGEKADKAGFMTAAGLARRVRTEFEAAVRLNPDNIDARSDLAEFYLEAPGIVGGGRDKAEEQVASLARMNPAKAHWVSARIAEKKKDLATAEQEYRAAIETSHGSASSWLNLGLFYRHRERWDDMVQALMHVRPAPLLDRPDALVDAADILIHSQRDLQEAAQLLRAYLNSSRQVEQAPAFKVHYLLGTAGEKMGDKHNAEAEYRAALNLAREYIPAQQGLQRLSR
jgi:tetratricopeptide (TPR) repeat protein